MSFYAKYPHVHAPPHTSRNVSSTAINTRLNAASGSGSGSGAGTGGPADSTASLGLGAKLRDMFDLQKFAVFDVAITIVELGNVPQLEGEFAAQWRFRGKRPKARDSVTPSRDGPKPKPSLPDLRFTQADPNKDQASMSSVSLRSTSTGGSSIASGLGPTSQSQAMKGKSISTPPLALPHVKHRMVEKKGSDPTPLRNSMRLDNESEPEVVESPLPTADLQISEQDSTPKLASTPMNGLNSSSSSAFPASTTGTVSSASSSTSHLSVPIPRSTPTQASSLLMERTASGQTTSGQSTHSQSALGVKEGGRPSLQRSRSNSGATNTGHHLMSSTLSTPRIKYVYVRNSRTGTTPYTPLKAHTCTWGEELRLTLRLPISKDKDRMAALGMKTNTPLLGEGAKSASGLRLVIQQLHTPASTTTTQPKQSVDTEVHHSPAHSAAIHSASTSAPTSDNTSQAILGEEAKEAKHERVKDHVAKGKATPFGRVNIDLAAFAGKGRTTRKFLLKGSRTNATVQIIVEMTCIGGDRNWVAPPLQEGHHVTARMKDVMGGRDASENLQKDLELMQTPSHSSSGSSVSQVRSTLSHDTSGVVGQGGYPKMHPQYKSYEHHLLSPDDAKFRTPARRPEDKPGKSGTNPEDRMAGTSSTANGEEDTETSGSPQTATSSTAVGSAPSTATPRSPGTNFWSNHRSGRSHHHRHHLHHLRRRVDTSGANTPRKTLGIAELPADQIIENIFNPHAGREDGPFTFIPVIQPQPEELPLRGEAEHHEIEQIPDEPRENTKTSIWKGRRRKNDRKDTVSSLINGGRSVSGINSAAASRGTSPTRLPRTGSSHAIHA